MGALSDYLQSSSSTPVIQEDPSFSGEVAKGVNRGLRHLGASGEQALGLGAEALGYDGAAKTLRGGAQTLREAAEAPRFAPEAESWDKVRGVGGALRWAGGHAGQMLPMIGGAVAGGAVAGPVGAGLSMMPDMVGQIDHGQQQNPEIAALPVGERVAQNLPMAALGSAAQMVPVGGMAARVMGGGAAAKTLVGAVGRNVAEGAATGYAGMAGANLATQHGIDPNAEFDMDQANEAGVGGAVAVGLMHAPGAIPGYMKGQGQNIGELGSKAKLWGSKKVEAMRAAAQDTAEAAGPAGEVAGKKMRSFVDDSMDMLASAKDKVSGYAEKIKRGEPLGVDAAEFAAATGEKANEMFGMADGQAKEWAKNTGEKILSKMGVDDARYNEIKEAVSNAGDRASQLIISKAQSAMDLGAKAKDAVTKFYTENKAAYDEARANDPTKKSEDTEGVRTAIVEALQDSGILQRRKELTEHPGTLQELAGGLNMMLNQMTKGPVKPEVFARLNSILGDDAAPLINSLKRSLHDNLGPTELREYLGNLNGLMEAQKRGGTLNNQLRELLTRDAQDSMTGYDLTELGDHGLAFARGDHMNEVANADSIHKTQHDMAANNAVKALFAERFGPNADAAFKILEDHAGITKNRASNEVRDNSKMSDLMREDKQRNENEHGAVQETDYTDEGSRTVMKKVKRDREGNVLSDSPPDAMIFGNDKADKKGNKKMKMNGMAMTHPDVFRTNKEQGINHAAEAMRRLSEEYPADRGYEVRWEPIDGGKDNMVDIPDGADAKGNQKFRREHQKGHVVVENLGDPGRFSIADIEAMKHDTHAHSRSESRFSVGKHSFDAVKIAKVMGDRVGANTESTGTYPARVADMFKRGVAELSDHYNLRIEVPDDVRVGGSNTDPMYWGDIKKLKYDTAEKGSPNRSPDEAHAELNDLRELYARATWNDAKLAKAKLKPFKATRDELDAWKERAKELSYDLENDLNKEYGPGSDIQERSMEAAPRKLQGDQVGPNRQKGDDRLHTESQSNRSYGEGISPRAIHERAQMEVADRAGNYVKAYDEVVDRTPGRWDKNGGLTKAGRNEILSGDHHGGIDIQNPNRGRSEMDDRMTNSRRFDALEFDDGQGRTAIGKDEQVHLQMAGLGDRDAPLFANGEGRKKPLTDREIANDKRNTAPADNDLVHRSNMDGSGHWLKRERYEKDFSHLIDTVDEWMRDSKTPAAKEITRKADVLVNNFAKMTEKDRTTLIDAAGRPPSFGTDARTDKIDYSDIEYANHTLRQVIDGLSVKQAMRELDARDYKLSKLAKHPDNDHYASVLMEEMSLLQARLKDGSKDGVSGIGKPSVAAEAINRLYDKYVDQAPGVKAESVKGAKGTKYESNPVQFKQGKAIGGKDPAYGQAERDATAADLRQRGDDFAKALDEAEKRTVSGSGGKTPGGKLKSDITEQAALQAEHEPMNEAIKAAGFGKKPAVEPRKMEGSPGPKAFAAKKAALLEAASSSDPALHEQLKASTDAKSLQRTVKHLSAAEKPDAGTAKAIEIANARLGELVRGSEDVALDLQRKFSKDAAKPTGKESDATVRAAVEATIKAMAPKVSVSWKGLTDMAYAGDYNHQLKAIRLSIHALNPMGTGYHESLHHFLASMRDAGAHDVAAVLEKAAASEHVIKQLNEIYKGNADVLKQLADPEERAAYMFQHWALDKNFQVSIKANTVFGRIRDFISGLMGHWTNDQRALHIMKYFQDGDWAKNSDKPSVVRRHLMETNKNDILAKAKSFAGPLGEMADAIVSAGSSRMRDSGVPALSEIADAVKLRGTDASGKDRGYIQAARIEMTSQMRRFAENLEPYKDPAHMADALDALQSGAKAKTPEGRLLAVAVKKQLRDARDYMVKAGVNVGDLGKDYFPRVWDTHYISKNQQAFRDMLEPYIRSGKMKGTADTLLRSLTTQEGSELGIESRETRQPGMQFTKERLLDFIDPRDAAEFLNKDLMGTMASYITQATRKAEWTRRLGNGKLEAMLDRATKQGASKEQLAMAETFLKGVDGTLGDGLNPTARRLMGNMVVYQNVRLLPMASFSMLIDPLGTMVRGGTTKDAWATFKRGMVGITKTFEKEGGEVHDQQTRWAELVGVVDNAMLTHAMSDVYTQGMVGGTAKSINNAFFKYNLVEGLNRNFRIGATEAAMKFIQRHADGKASAHSGRWIKELGLDARDIKTTADGHLALTEAEGLTPEQAGKIKAAVNQWVDGAILRPDAADKPVWMNDAHFALISHLKQFVYSFQHTILERTMHEMKHGNYTPVMALASYLPVMMAADMAKGLLVNGGSQPDWQKGWTLADYVENGMERAGFYGAGQFGVDVIKDIRRGNTGAFALTGPTIEQLRDGVETLGGHKQFGNTVIEALPANALYKHSLGGEGKADPVHTS